MARRRLFWKVYPTYLLVTVVCIGGVAWLAVRSVRNFHYEQMASDLQLRARLIVAELSASPGESPDQLDAQAKRLGRTLQTRITVIAPDGKVLAESERSPGEMGPHNLRPEIRAALAGRVGRSVRHSDTLGANLMYVAMPVPDAAGGVAMVVRTALPLSEVDATLHSVTLWIVAGGGVIALLAAWLSGWLSRRISRPLTQMKLGAERFATGDFSQAVRVNDSVELGGLADALNRMAAQLDEKIRAITAAKGEREAVLSSMVEGVLAVDNQRRIVSLNEAAGRMLDVEGDGADAPLGRPIDQVVRHPQIGGLIDQVLGGGAESAEGEIVRHGAEDRFCQVSATAMRDAAGRRLGAVLVLNDVTRLRRLETVRRDFVANVSHELKTPITSIKGFVETLREGAIDDPAKARRFLEILGRQAERVSAIIEDLLVLAHLEQGAGKAALGREAAAIRPLLASAIDDCQGPAGERRVAVELSCPADLAASVNPALVEQAVVNLLDNAIKYSEPGGRVELSAGREGDALAVRVRDHGCGIAPEHLPRLFERFYRVDKARSRKLGGTGLGLAIVKHIAAAHGGRVDVQSAPGQGSTFTLRLPTG